MIGQAGCRRGLDSAACYDPASIIPPTPSLWGVAGTAGRVYQSPESPAQFAGESVMWVGWGGRAQSNVHRGSLDTTMHLVVLLHLAAMRGCRSFFCGTLTGPRWSRT